MARLRPLDRGRGVTADGSNSVVAPIRLAIVSPYPLFPTVAGGKIRIVQLARCLAERGVDVTLVTPFHLTQRHHLYAAEDFTLRQVYYPFLIPFLFTGRPFPYTYLTSIHPGFAAFVRPMISAADIVQFEQVEFAELGVSIAGHKPVVYDSQNVEYDYVRSECRSKRVKEIVGKRVFRLEEQLMRSSSRIFACSEADRRRLCALYGTPKDRIVIAPNGLGDIRSQSDNAVAPESRHPRLADFKTWAIFSGSDVEHNRGAVRFIVDRLAPRLENRCAFVVHGGCGRRFNDAAPRNVFFDSDLDSFSTYVRPQTVALNPVVQGSGTNLKVLFYLAHGLSVVTTPFGMRGYDELRDFVTLAEPDDFSAAVFTSPRVVRPDPHEIRRRYAWSHTADRMLRTYRSILSSDGVGS